MKNELDFLSLYFIRAFLRLNHHAVFRLLGQLVLHIDETCLELLLVLFLFYEALKLKQFMRTLHLLLSDYLALLLRYDPVYF